MRILLLEAKKKTNTKVAIEEAKRLSECNSN